MTEEQERKSFEREMSLAGVSVGKRNGEGEYIACHIEGYWLGWSRRAALSQPASPVPLESAAKAWEDAHGFDKHGCAAFIREHASPVPEAMKREMTDAELAALNARELELQRIERAPKAMTQDEMLKESGRRFLERESRLSADFPRLPWATPAPEAPTVEQAITALVTALAESKGWMRDYADSVVRDAVDRRVPEAMTDAEIDEQTQGWPFQEAFDFKIGVRFAEARLSQRNPPDTASIYRREPKPYAMTTAERVAWVKGHSAGWDAALKNEADAGGSEVK